VGQAAGTLLEYDASHVPGSESGRCRPQWPDTFLRRLDTEPPKAPNPPILALGHRTPSATARVWGNSPLTPAAGPQWSSCHGVVHPRPPRFHDAIPRWPMILSGGTSQGTTCEPLRGAWKFRLALLGHAGSSPRGNSHRLSPMPGDGTRIGSGGRRGHRPCRGREVGAKRSPLRDCAFILEHSHRQGCERAKGRSDPAPSGE
jgi:hypothetical protein